MRWIWIDRFIEFTPKQSATAVKNITLAEEHLHDLYPAFPIMPASLIIEGMAQTAGILVGEARNFKEKVILGKIGRAIFYQLVRPGQTLIYAARVEQLSDDGAAIFGTVSVLDPAVSEVQTPVAEIELVFSHIDKNLAGMQFPEHNFVFTEQFTQLLATYRSVGAIAL